MAAIPAARPLRSTVFRLRSCLLFPDYGGHISEIAENEKELAAIDAYERAKTGKATSASKWHHNEPPPVWQYNDASLLISLIAHEKIHKRSALSSRDKERFNTLVSQWFAQRGISSSTTEMVLCPAYQQIIGLGEKALPFIFERLREEGTKPEQWFWALRSITGENPVPQVLWGRRREMARIWLEWAVHNGY